MPIIQASHYLPITSVAKPIPDDDPLFKALADPSRRKLLDVLHAGDGQTLNQLCEHLDMTRQGVTQHLALLEAVPRMLCRRVRCRRRPIDRDCIPQLLGQPRSRLLNEKLLVPLANVGSGLRLESLRRVE